MAGTGNSGGKPPTEWETSASAFKSKRLSEFHDPCQEAAERSHRCLQRNNFDKSFCTDYFEAYKDCKKRWMDERREAKLREKRESRAS